MLNVFSNMINLYYLMILVYIFKIEGALYAMVLSQSIVFFVTLGLIMRTPWFNKEYFNKKFDIQNARNKRQFYV